VVTDPPYGIYIAGLISVWLRLCAISLAAQSQSAKL
jgi:hypothetical protein